MALAIRLDLIQGDCWDLAEVCALLRAIHFSLSYLFKCVGVAVAMKIADTCPETADAELASSYSKSVAMHLFSLLEMDPDKCN